MSAAVAIQMHIAVCGAASYGRAAGTMVNVEGLQVDSGVRLGVKTSQDRYPSSYLLRIHSCLFLWTRQQLNPTDVSHALSTRQRP
jgi:hypothetical protein